MALFDKKFNFFIYHNPWVQNYYIRVHYQIIEFLSKYLKNKSCILDVGCGTGNFLGKLSQLNRDLKLFGLDESRKMIEVARKKFKGIKFFLNRAEDLPFEDDYFDFITIVDALYYFKNQEKTIQECFRVLRQGGYLFILSPSTDQFLSRISIKTSKIFPTEIRSKHFYFRDLKSLAERTGFNFIERKLSHWPGLPFLKYWLILFRK